ncbi:hypothetical protein FB451DRAFT_101484 [Mycena latifolia]|nr:hypothetical protein FB451DRAFT_101484 [Mycena latifolia]
MNVGDAVRQHAHYHAQLVAGIAELEYVADALVQQESHIADLEGRVEGGTRKIKALERKTTTQRLVYEELLHSTTRRLAAKLTGRLEKFEAEADKEEREYLEALEKESQAKESHAVLETMIAEGKAVVLTLKSKAEISALRKKDLAELYSKIFDGPTHAYPEDDQLEYQLQLAQRQHTDIHTLLGRESQALLYLQSANSTLRMCASKMQDAYDYWRADSTKSKMMKRGMLSAAEGLAIQTSTNVQQAILVSPQVQPIADSNSAKGSIWPGVVFNHLSSIKPSIRNVGPCRRRYVFSGCLAPNRRY